MLDHGLKIRTMVLPDVFLDHDSPQAQYDAAGLNARHIVAMALVGARPRDRRLPAALRRGSPAQRTPSLPSGEGGCGSRPKLAVAMAAKRRADQLLVEQGLAESRAKAQALILAGLVSCGGRRVDKPGRAARRGCRARPQRARPSLGVARRGQARACARPFRDRRRPARSRSISAPRPAASPMCCWRAARRGSTRSMSGTASSPGSCARTRASSSTRG